MVGAVTMKTLLTTQAWLLPVLILTLAGCTMIPKYQRPASPVAAAAGLMSSTVSVKDAIQQT